MRHHRHLASTTGSTRGLLSASHSPPNASAESISAALEVYSMSVDFPSPVLDPRQDAGPCSARQIDVLVRFRRTPEDVARAGAVRRPPSARGWRTTALGGVPSMMCRFLRPALAVDVQPDVHGVVANLDQIVEPVPVDVVDSQARCPRCPNSTGSSSIVTYRFEENVPAGQSSRLPVPQHTVAAARPIANVTASEAHDVRNAVAVHLRELDFACR